MEYIEVRFEETTLQAEPGMTSRCRHPGYALLNQVFCIDHRIDIGVGFHGIVAAISSCVVAISVMLGTFMEVLDTAIEVAIPESESSQRRFGCASLIRDPRAATSRPL